MRIRLGLMLVLVFAAALIEGCAPGTVAPARGGGINDLAGVERQVVELVNRHRSSIGLGALTSLPAISESARSHSHGMAGSSELSHRGAKERFDALRVQLQGRGFGENVGMNNGYAQPVPAVVEGWLGSSGHRKNIEGNFNSTGVGVARDGDGTLWFTQIFVLR